ncbi:HlyD family type I secretion periplasmic adaptor subunit [Planktomarina temperata]|nr:HlyD family type I secretion periplasmic adaptor subunit [Planktomarina temperata]
METENHNKSIWTAYFPLLLGFTSLFLLILATIFWGLWTNIEGAVIANGKLSVENNQQIVQHEDGGVISEILASDGDEVQAGDILISFDDVFLKSELAIVESQLFEVLARRARLESERDERDEMIMPNWLKIYDKEKTDVQSLFETQRRLFHARKATVEEQRKQLDEQIEQIQAEIVGVRAELKSIQIQYDLFSQERSTSEALLKKGLVQKSQVLSLRRNEANLSGSIGRLTSKIAQLERQITTVRIEELRLASSRREEAMSLLSDVGVSQREMLERRTFIEERLSRMDVRAPVAGTVLGSKFFANNAVVRPADPIMYIVPEERPFIVDAQIDPVHIDQVYSGQKAYLRLSALDQRTTPEINGKVLFISADALVDEVAKTNFYHVQILPDIDELNNVGLENIVLGMPVEVYLRTGKQTPLRYLTKPLLDYFNKALRE